MTDESLWGFHIRKLLVKNAKKTTKRANFISAKFNPFFQFGMGLLHFKPLGSKSLNFSFNQNN